MGDFKLDHLISERAARRSLSHFTSAPTEGRPEGFKPHPDTLTLGWGVPTDGFFPIDSIEVNLVDYPFQMSRNIPMTNASLECLSFNSSNGGTQSGTTYKMSSNSITIPRYSDNDDTIDISSGLQYSNVPGMKQVAKFVKALVERVGEPKYEGWESIICTGAGDGINKATDAILDHNDVILIEEFSFTPILMSVHNCGAIAVPVKLNINNHSDGIDIEYLTELLENWETLKPGLRRPKALYTIPTGQNPIGLTQTLETRKRIYSLAQKYDFFIIEDDPYGYLTLPPYHEDDRIIKLKDFPTVDEYLKNHLIPSYLTIDTEGRVIRLETFSKLFGPGLRLGFIVAHKRIIEVITNYAAIVTKFPSGVSQMIFNNVVQQKWVELKAGLPGLLR